VLVALAVELVALTAFAAVLQIDFYDGYDYLNNARIMAGQDLQGSPIEYTKFRPPLIPFIYSFIVRCYQPAGAGLTLILPHTFALLLSVLSLVAVYFLLRQSFSALASLTGAALLAFNPLFVRYAAFVMTDLPVMLFLTVGMLYYLKAKRTGRTAHYALACIFLLATFLTKYTTIIALGSLAVFEIADALIAPKARIQGIRLKALARAVSDRRAWATVLGAVIGFYLAHVLVHALFYEFGAESFTFIREVFLHQIDANTAALPSDPPHEYLQAASKVFTPVILLLALGGIVTACIRRTDADLLHLSWLAIFLLVIHLAITHRETRYILPVFPAVAYFIIRGGLGLARILPKRLQAALQRFPAIAICLVLIVLYKQAERGAEIYERMDDPLFNQPFLSKIASDIIQQAPERDVIWINDMFAMYPEDPVYLQYDENFFFHHIYVAATTFWLDRPIYQVPLNLLSSHEAPPENELIPLFPKSGVLIHSMSHHFNTSNAHTRPSRPYPLTVAFVERRTLQPLQAKESDGVLIYADPAEPDKTIALAMTPLGWSVERNDFQNQGWLFFQKYEQEDLPAPIERFMTSAPDSIELYKESSRTDYSYR